MKIKLISFIIFFLIMILLQPCEALDSNTDNVSQTNSALKIYLPRKVLVEDDSLKLGRVGIILGQEPLVAKANEIMLGHFSTLGQKIVLDRSAILSRLACNGIDPQHVLFTGAEETTVQKKHSIIKSSEFVKIADSFLKKSTSAGLFCQTIPIRTPKDLLLPPTDKDVTLSPCIVQSSAANQAKVRISVLSDSNEIGVGEVTFRLKYNCRTAVTLVEVPAGEVINPENIKIIQNVSDYPEPASWGPPYGFIAKRTLPENTVIQPNMIEPVKPTINIKRNETVVIRIELPGLIVTALGKAIQQGNTGEYIKVRNIDSQRIIMAKVNEDGTVKPVF
ncbi:MAG: flagella basal body P-ring formation protein FlgA [Planctomycetes bacterium RBG_13_44_8b]|nr:MAG: flagella basal body P-ring formation protein FlgA [Planctomycetes bacterium RBG_13_44_8b]